MESLPPALLALGAGVASHLFYFKIGEHHMLPVVYLQVFLLACITSTFALLNFTEATVSSALGTVATLASSWLLGVYASLLTYRLFFHPLNKFPGPWQARVGDLWMSTRLTGLNAYYVFDNLHKKNGRFVRIGSNSLSITDPDMMQPAYGANARVTKSDWYDGSTPYHSMHTTRDKGLHDRRRRVWAPAFSDKALREYEATVQEFNDKLVQKVAEAKGSSMNMTT